MQLTAEKHFKRSLLNRMFFNGLIREMTSLRCFMLVVFLLGFFNTAYATVVNIPIKDKYSFSIINQLEYYHDATNKLGITEIMSPAIAQQFKPYLFNEESIAPFNTTMWVRFNAENLSDHNTQFYIVTDKQMATYDMKMYVKNAEVSSLFSATLFNYIYFIKVPAKETLTIYAKIDSRAPGTTGIYLFDMMSVSKLNNYLVKRFLFVGFNYGVPITLMLFHIFIFLMLKQRVYLFYVAYLFFYITWRLFYEAFISDFVYSGIPPSILFPLSDSLILMIIAFLLLFSMSALRTQEYSKTFYNIACMWVGLTAAFVLYRFYLGTRSPPLSFQIFLLVGLIGPVVTAIIALKNHYHPARYYMIGLAAVFIGTAMHVLAMHDLLPSEFTETVPIFVALEMIMQSLVLADRYNLIQQERDTIQVEALKQQKKLTRAFERFVPNELLTQMNKESILDVKLGDHLSKKMIILFADIRSFTQFAEKMTAETTFQFINDYLGVAGPLIRKYDGFVDKYIGDAIMALFGENSVIASISLAIIMHKKLEQMRLKANKPVINIGIGLHKGDVILGTVGEKYRMDGTVIGDAVNLASRLEGLNKIYETQIIISEDLYYELPKEHAFLIFYLDKVKVKGKSIPLDIYEVYNVNPPAMLEAKKRIQDDFEKAVKLYQTRQFESALSLLRECLQRSPECKNIITLYIDRCEKMLRDGCPPDWTGVTTQLTK